MNGKKCLWNDKFVTKCEIFDLDPNDQMNGNEIWTCNSSHGIAAHSSQDTAATCTRMDDNGPRFCRITSTVVRRKVTIDTRSRRRHVDASDGSDGEDILLVFTFSSHTSLAISTVLGLLLLSDVNGFNLLKWHIQISTKYFFSHEMNRIGKITWTSRPYSQLSYRQPKP